jgi:hypothetical protein
MSDMFSAPENTRGEIVEEIDPFAEVLVEEQVVESEPDSEQVDDEWDFEADDIEDSVEVGSEISLVDSDTPGDVNVTDDLPYIEEIDALPGVGGVGTGYPKHLTPLEEKKEKKLKLTQINMEVKDFTDTIEARRLEESESYPSNYFVYDVQAVRLLGQTGCSNVEMAAYFNVEEATISKLMRDPSSDFYQVYHRASAVLCMTLRQSQIKTALGGDSKMQIHLGKHVLGQTDSVKPITGRDDLTKNTEARRTKITTLTQTITEWDD